MKSPEFRKQMAEERRKLAVSELLVELMAEQNISVRQLANEASVSTSTILGMRSGDEVNPTLEVFLRRLHSVGAELVVKRGHKLVTL